MGVHVFPILKPPPTSHFLHIPIPQGRSSALALSAMQSFLIHLSNDGHLGCFHVLAIINSAAVNTGVHVCLSILVSSVCMPSSGIAGSYGSSSSSLSRNLHTVLHMALLVCIPVNSVRGFPFLCTLSNIYCL